MGVPLYTVNCTVYSLGGGLRGMFLANEEKM